MRPTRSSLIVFAAMALAAGLVSYGAVRVCRSAYLARLPVIPVVPGQSTAIRAHLLEADRLAREQPTSADAVAALGLAYHADMFYDEAQRACGVAERLSGDWRWSYYRALAVASLGVLFPDNRRIGSVMILENDGHQQFTMHEVASSPTHLITLAVRDLDGDGKPDLVTGGMHISAPYDRLSRVTLWSNRGWPSRR